jgi:RimJ/RimL family protein N-acetyltransferase
MLKGALVGLVPLQSTDELAIYRWLNDPRMRKAAGRQTWKACYSLEQVQDLIRERLAQPSRLDLMVVDLPGETPQGLVEITHLHPMRDSAQLSLIWAEGEEEMMQEAIILSAVYAFNTQGLHRLWTRVPSSNQALVEAFQTAGFRVEGVLREDHFDGGTWRDSLLLSLLSAEARSC